MLTPDHVSAAELLSSVAKRIEVKEDRLKQTLDLPPEKARIFGREMNQYGPLGREGFLQFFVRLAKRSWAAAELETALHNAGGSPEVVWLETYTNPRLPRKHAAGGEDVRRLLHGVAQEFDAALLAYRKGDLLPGSRTRPQLTTVDTTPLQWIWATRAQLKPLLDQQDVPHDLPGEATVTSHVHRAKASAPGTLDELLEALYEVGRAEFDGLPSTGALVAVMWPKLLEACSKPDTKPTDVHLYRSGPHLKRIGAAWPTFDKEALRKRVDRRLKGEKRGGGAG